MPDNLECVDRQWESRSVASTLLADAIDSLMAQGMGEHDAISALEDALQIRRITLNLQIAQD
jgi:hypothetical protein